MRSCESWILSYLLNSLWQVPLLFAAGCAAARAARTIGDAAEHRVWVAVLLLQSILPACPALPRPQLRSLFHWGHGALRAGEGQVSVSMGAGFGEYHFHSGILAALALAYAAATAYFVARFIWRCIELSAIRRHAHAIVLPGDAALYWTECCERFAVGNVSLAASSRIFSPVTIGLSRKLLLLPTAMVSGLQQADLRTVIAHEFAHMRRNDFFKNLVYEVLSLPVSYHPLFRLTRERIMESREIVCDSMAADLDGRSHYARSLLRLASLLVAGTAVRTPHTIGIFDAGAFERRLMKLTEKQAENRTPRRAAVAACVVLGIATCCSALSLHLRVDTAAVLAAASSRNPAYVKVSAGVMAGNVLTKVMPKYPPEAKKAGIQGTVVLSATIGKKGKVEMLKVVSGPKELQQSSLDAVRQWRYKPFLLNGKPVAVETTVNVIYTLATPWKPSPPGS